MMNGCIMVSIWHKVNSGKKRGQVLPYTHSSDKAIPSKYPDQKP